jgi:preprotein translocase subunit SecA
VHYTVSKKDQKVELTPAGFKFAEQIVGKGLFDLADPWAFYIINALKAKEVSLFVGRGRREGGEK